MIRIIRTINQLNLGQRVLQAVCSIQIVPAHLSETLSFRGTTRLLQVTARLDVTGVHTPIAHDGRAHAACKSTRDTLA